MSSELLLITGNFNIRVGDPCDPDCVRFLNLLESMVCRNMLMYQLSTVQYRNGSFKGHEQHPFKT